MSELDTIYSGGQTGADIAGLVIAEKLGLKTGGWATQGYRTENGKKPEVLRDRFHLKESPTYNYAWRTEKNVIDSDATLIFVRVYESRGTLQTIEACEKHHKDYLVFNPFIADEDTFWEMNQFVLDVAPKILNIAGNRESVAPGIFTASCHALYRLLTSVRGIQKSMMGFDDDINPLSKSLEV